MSKIIINGKDYGIRTQTQKPTINKVKVFKYASESEVNRFIADKDVINVSMSIDRFSKENYVVLYKEEIV